MTQVFPRQKAKSGRQRGHNGHESQEHEKGEGMTVLAEKEVHFHTRSLPEAKPPPVDPFPAPLWRGLLAGLLAGSALGLLFGALLYRNDLVIPGWEGLYSMGPFTFHIFWLLIGAAVGASTAGITAIILTPFKQPEEGEQDP